MTYPQTLAFRFNRVLIGTPPYLEREPSGYTFVDHGQGWPCRWIRPEPVPEPPFSAAFLLRLELSQTLSTRVHLAADERYELFIDGQSVARGNERGEAWHWNFESFDLELEPGSHVLAAQIWALGPRRPWAQVSLEPGFLFSPESPEAVALLGTGVAPWQSQVLTGCHFFDPSTAAGRAPGDLGAGAGLELDAREFLWGFENGVGAWGPVTVGEPGNNGFRLHVTQPAHLLFPATLPPQLERPLSGLKVLQVDAGTNELFRLEDALSDELLAWQNLLDDGLFEDGLLEDGLLEDGLLEDGLLEDGLGLTIPAHSQRRILIDLERYHCYFPTLEVVGGRDARITLSHAEALLDSSGHKGQRDEVMGKRLWGLCDLLVADGERRSFTPHWWRAGRYLQLEIQTEADALTLERVHLVETRYPLEMESRFEPGRADLERVLRVSLHTLQQCAHETYMDCPYYEQLQYIGDTRLQALSTYVISRDDALARKALSTFERSRINPSGLPTAASPAASSSLIPPFALWWVAMVHDFALWRGDLEFVRGLMPGVRAVMDRFQAEARQDGLIRNPKGWNFHDWVKDWSLGVPPDAGDDVNALLNWQVAWLWRQVAELERFVGEPELANRASRLSHAQAERTRAAFWNPERGLFADDTAHQHYSQHAQCLAILSGNLEPELERRLAQTLFSDSSLAPCSLYFSHYLFETCYRLERADALFGRLEAWTQCLNDGLTTFPENFEQPRSDCHAWSAHPLYHFASSILGIRPSSFGFETVRIAPLLGPLEHAGGSVVHPKGMVSVNFQNDRAGLTAHIELPEGLHGHFVWRGLEYPLLPGRQTLTVQVELGP